MGEGGEKDGAPVGAVARTAAQHARKELLVPCVRRAEAGVAPVLNELDGRVPDEDVADVEVGAEAALRFEARVVVAEGGVQHVRAHQHVRARVAPDELPRLEKHKGVGVDGQGVDSELRQVKHELHLVQAHLPKVGRAPA